MKFLIFGIVFIAFFGLLNGQGCRHPGTKHDWPVGEFYNPIGDCKTYYCTADDKYLATYCGLIQAPNKNCKTINEDWSKPYPECCAYFECPDE